MASGIEWKLQQGEDSFTEFKHGATLEDLDGAAVERFLADHYDERAPAGPLEGREVALRYLRALGCLEDAIPTVSGLLCFGLEPERWFPDARVSAVRIAGTDVSGDFAARREIGGRLQVQLDEALAFVTTHLAAPSRVAGAVRLETGLPEKVVREAISNALSHRDYRAAAQTRVLVFDDRVEIGNPGGLLNRLTVDGILAGVTQRRNPRIATVLARSGRGERLGLGVRLMVKEMKDRGLPPPEFSETSGHFRVVLRLREPHE